MFQLQTYLRVWHDTLRHLCCTVLGERVEIAHTRV